MPQIKDATGTGNGLKIDKNNRAHTDSVIRSQDEQEALNSNAYNINTGGITLTTANESGIFYIKSNENLPIVIKEILVILGSTTGGSGEGTVNIKKNPTAGTLVSGAVDVDINENRDFNSEKTLSADIFKGAEGNTVTDGNNFASTTRSSFGTVITFDASTMVLRRGNSLAVTYTPPSGNTSQSIKIAVTAFLETADV